MKERKKCKIIQDLLPIYVENLLSHETKEYVTEHLEECDTCKNIYECINDNINIKDGKMEQQEVNYLKKFKNKMGILKTILLIIIIVIAIIMGRRILIVTSLSNKAKSINLDNYYAKVEGIFAGEYKISECYYKNGDYIIKTTTYSNESGAIKMLFYKNSAEQILLTESDEGKSKNQNAVLTEITPLPRYEGIDTLLMALVYGVEKVNLGDRESYVLKNKELEQYIDKETGFLVKQINRKNNTVTNYQYEFGKVTELESTLTDITDFEDIENHKEL